MNSFIEIHQEGKSVLINLGWVYVIRPLFNGKSVIYFTSRKSNGITESICTDESYDEVLRKVCG